MIEGIDLAMDVGRKMKEDEGRKDDEGINMIEEIDLAMDVQPPAAISQMTSLFGMATALGYLVRPSPGRIISTARTSSARDIRTGIRTVRDFSEN
jgi:hypothetical protein